MKSANLVGVVGLVLGMTGGPSTATAADVNEDWMRAYYAAWTKGDVDAVMGHFSKEIVYADVATGDRAAGTQEVRAFVQKFVDTNPGVELTTASITIAKSSAAVEWVMSGGSGDEAWSVPGVCIFQLDNGRISRATDYWNKE